MHGKEKPSEVLDSWSDNKRFVLCALIYEMFKAGWFYGPFVSPQEVMRAANKGKIHVHQWNKK
jgi:hypothetical protein